MQILVGNEPKVNILSFKKIKYGLSCLFKISISSPREELKQQVISLRASLNANNSKYNFKVNHALSNKKKQLLSHFLTLNVFNSINLSECTGSHKV
jgi:hypothetical protein